MKKVILELFYDSFKYKYVYKISTGRVFYGWPTGKRGCEYIYYLNFQDFPLI